MPRGRRWIFIRLLTGLVLAQSAYRSSVWLKARFGSLLAVRVRCFFLVRALALPDSVPSSLANYGALHGSLLDPGLQRTLLLYRWRRLLHVAVPSRRRVALLLLLRLVRLRPRLLQSGLPVPLSGRGFVRLGAVVLPLLSRLGSGWRWRQWLALSYRCMLSQHLQVVCQAVSQFFHSLPHALHSEYFMQTWPLPLVLEEKILA